MKILNIKRVLMVIGLTIGIIFLNSTYGTANSLNNGQQVIISQQEAKNIALESIPGTIIRTGLDTDNGITYYEVYILTGANIKEVYIHAQTGEIISIDTIYLSIIIGVLIVATVGLVLFLRRKK